jgi:hypothetical protein
MQKIFTALFVIAVALPTVASAQVVNEIYYSPSTKAWVEVYNNTDSPIDLTQYKILDAGAAVNGHSITSISGSPIPPHEYGVIAKDSTSVAAAHLYKSSLGIKTSGDTISLKLGSNTVSSVQFTDGAAASGESWQNFDSGWQSSVPTPGAENVVSVGESTSTESGTSSEDAAGEPASSTTGSKTIKLTASAGKDRQVFLGAIQHFVAISNNSEAKFVWSFGDGTSDTGKEVDHTFKFPGTYVVVLDATFGDMEVISRVRVKVISLNLSVNEITPDYISIKNSSTAEVDLGDWQLITEDRVFYFPKYTILLAGDRLLVATSTSGIAAKTLGEVKIGKASTSTPIVVTENKRLETIKELKKEVAIRDMNFELARIKEELAVLPRESIESPKVAHSRQNNVQAPSKRDVRELANIISAFTEATTSATTKKASWTQTLKSFFFGK